MMTFELSFQGQLQLGNLAAQLPLGQLRHFLCSGLTCDQSSQHQPAGSSEDIGGHAGQLDIGGPKVSTDDCAPPLGFPPACDDNVIRSVPFGVDVEQNIAVAQCEPG